MSVPLPKMRELMLNFDAQDTETFEIKSFSWSCIKVYFVYRIRGRFHGIERNNWVVQHSLIVSL